MSALSEIYVKKETLETLLKVLNAKGEKGIKLTISQNNQTDKFGQNVSSYVSQTKEERDAKKDRFFTGNGKVFWTDGSIVVADKKETPASQAPAPIDEDLPF